MRGPTAVVALLAGCYAPAAPTGLACDPTEPHCPRGQSCVAGPTGDTCETGGGGGGVHDAPVDQPATGDDALIDAPPMIDSSIDAPASLDSDGDTIVDTADNCPAKPNTDQYNEDGDRFGDACDPCPPIANNNPPDGDGDGVADACDPRPAMAGDSIFLFDGFQAGVPTTGWFKSGTWTAVAGGSIQGDAAGNRANLTVAGPTSGHLTVRAAMTLDEGPPTGDAAAGVIESYDHSARTGIYCHITTWGPTETPLVVNSVSSSGNIIDIDANFGFTAGTTYGLDQRRDGDTRTCGGVRGATTGSASGITALAPATPEVGMRVVRSKATFAWILVVANN